MALIDELKLRRNAAYNTIEQIEGRISEEEASLKRVRIGMADLDTAIAALEPAPAEPEAEPVAADQMFAGVPAWANERWQQDAHLRSFIVDESAVFHDGGPMPVSNNAIVDIYFDGDLLRDKLAEDYDWIDFECAYRVVMQPAGELYEDPTVDAIAEYIERETHTDDLRTAEGEDEMRRIGEAEDAVDATLAGDPEPTELDAPASIVDDPELQAAVARAEATLQQAEPAAYVGLNDPELDDAWDAMKAREEAEKPKPRFSIFGRIKEDA